MNNDNNLKFCIAGLNCRAGYATDDNNNDLIAFPLSGYSMLQMNNKLSLINIS